MSPQPNFLIIVADDLGFSDLGCFGGEIETPNLNGIAGDGVRSTGFHTASACSPTRSMLMSGTDNHIAGVGQMAEYQAFDKFFKDLGDGYLGQLNHNVAAMPDILANGGYTTIMSGKWHLGLTPETGPAARGFQKTFALLDGASNHYGYEPQGSNFKSATTRAPTYTRNGVNIPISQLPKDFYSTETFTTELISMLSEAPSEKPFLAYLPFTAPHWPLQAPKHLIAKYKGMYDDGPEALRERRLKRLIELGLVDKSVKAHPMVRIGNKEWAKMTEEERKRSAKTMEVYAAMVDSMDQNIGRIVKWLKDHGKFDNTFILFQSDNGAEGAVLEATPMFGTLVNEVIAKHYDNSFDNIGAGNSYVWYGDRWAQAATAPSRLFKAWITEGGIRCPLIVRYPPIAATGGKVTQQFSTVMDILPTMLDLAGLKHPTEVDPSSKLHKMRGKTWVPHLSGRSERIHSEDSFHGWELFGQCALRAGDHKIVFIPRPRGNGKWMLFDLSKDSGETTDIAETHPKLLADMIEKFHQYGTDVGLVTRQRDYRKAKL